MLSRQWPCLVLTHMMLSPQISAEGLCKHTMWSCSFPHYLWQGVLVSFYGEEGGWKCTLAFSFNKPLICYECPIGKMYASQIILLVFWKIPESRKKIFKRNVIIDDFKMSLIQGILVSGVCLAAALSHILRQVGSHVSCCLWAILMCRNIVWENVKLNMGFFLTHAC